MVDTVNETLNILANSPFVGCGETGFKILCSKERSGSTPEGANTLLANRCAAQGAALAKPVCLDLFCGAGGAARGLQQAGCYVVGVDIKPQPRYAGDEFHQADAMTFPLDGFDFIWASPPCQGYSDLRHRTGKSYPLLIEHTRHRLSASGLPWVIENVEGAPLIDPVVLCGTMFPGLRVIRHRLFESSPHQLHAPIHPRHPLVFTHDKRKAHHGKMNQDVAFVQVTGGGNCSIANARGAMGISWMNKAELNEAIPPAYSRYIGELMMPYIQKRMEGAA